MIHIVVAQAAEARPLVARYNLRSEAGEVFPFWRGEDTVLCVAGCGKTAAAAATGYLFHGTGETRDGAWLNLGMAGHSELEIGRGLLAHRVIDDGSGATWYPPFVSEPACPTATVITVERLEEDYEGEGLYDTEAAGFFAAASRFATSELVHAFKIVIDNHGATLGDNFSPEVVEDLVESKLAVLDGVIAELRRVADEVRVRRDRALSGRALGVRAAGER